jgi:hypothetical protein
MGVSWIADTHSLLEFVRIGIQLYYYITNSLSCQQVGGTSWWNKLVVFL